MSINVLVEYIGTWDHIILQVGLHKRKNKSEQKTMDYD